MSGYDLADTPDRHLQEAEMALEDRLAAHLEIDCEGGGEYVCDRCTADRAELEAITAELARREAEGIAVDDPSEPTFEERYAPFGPAWQEEQNR